MDDFNDVRKAISILLALCDGARSADGRGFNKYDADSARRLAGIVKWTPHQARYALDMLRKYRTQLIMNGINYNTLSKPTLPQRQSNVDMERYVRLEDVVRPVTGKVDRTLVKLKGPFNPYTYGKMKEIPGAQFDKPSGQWFFTFNEVSASVLVRVLEINPYPVSQEDLKRIHEKAGLAKTKETMSAMSAPSKDLGKSGLRGELKEFQKAGVEYALQGKRVLIADEPGLGKTMQALGTIEYAQAYPALIICPACVKLNWEREAAAWLPKNRTIEVVSGRTPFKTTADVVIMNYDILSPGTPKHDEDGNLKAPKGQLEECLKRGFRTVVCDESHYVKSSRTLRTKAVKAVTKGVDYVLLLSGTPIINFPIELKSQIQILRRLDEFGGYHGYDRRFCNPQENWFQGKKVTTLTGASSLDELHKLLRVNCMVRRRKSDVLKELPAKQRTLIPVEISNRPEYRMAENELVRWLKLQIDKDKEFMASIAHLPHGERENAITERKLSAEYKAARAEALIRLSALKRITMRGKLDACKEWIEDFLETGQKLVVFAHHHEAIDDLMKAFPDVSVRIRGDDSIEKRQRAVDAFQGDDKVRLMVASTLAAGVGITLTAASNVLFLELEWTPAAHDQAEDRTHRIGQKDSVTAWYLVGYKTVDESIYAKLQVKRIIVDKVTDGKVNPDEIKTSIMGEVMKEFIGKAMGDE